ncbi:MAG: methionyl-tRNA formyltransferase [Flavobacteriaceae bacterium]|nr:methionyl-tRNA formyltransferase [Flavobacteriaceae bacterium]
MSNAKRKIRIVFMGTPEFSVTILNSIIENKYLVVGVITAPDKLAGRGRKLNQSAVKKYALKKGLKLLQPINLKNEEFQKELKTLKATLQIVVAFRMLPKSVWSIPKYGTFNLHASLLPAYRGAAPINWAIINGETKTGVTTFFIDDKIDTGEIILQKEIKILPDENAGNIHNKLMYLGAKLVCKTILEIKNNTIKTKAQPKIKNKIAPKIYSETCKLNFNNNLESIYNKVRGLSPYPVAWTTINNDKETIKVKIYTAKKEFIEHTNSIGKIITTKKELKIATKDGYLIITELKVSGKRKMDIISFLNGFTFHKNAFVH